MTEETTQAEAADQSPEDQSQPLSLSAEDIAKQICTLREQREAAEGNLLRQKAGVQHWQSVISMIDAQMADLGVTVLTLNREARVKQILEQNFS